MKPYYDHNGITIYHGDCLEVLPMLSEPVDAVIADPPYGTTACAWDTVIPFAPMWAQIKRLVKPRAAVALFGSQPFTSALVMSNPKWFKYEWVWEKDTGTNFYNAPYQPLKVHEGIVIFSSAGASFTERGAMSYHPQSTKGKAYTAAQGRAKHTYHAYADAHTTVNTGTRYPRSVLRFNTDGGLHPTQKPLDLLRYLILTYTNPGDLVLDFTMGSGTTIVAAKHLGRRAIGVEMDERYVNVAIDRLQQEVLAL